MVIWTPGDPPPPELEAFHFFDWVTHSIAITCYEVACHRDILDIEGVEYIVSIGTLSPDESLTGRPTTWVRDIEDATPDVDLGEITRAVDAIRELSHRGRTLVHCAAGVSRSPGLVTIALCLDNGWDWDQAKTQVQYTRRATNIHPLTETRLKEWLGINRQG